MEKTNCPICGQDAELLSTDEFGNAKRYHCIQCGWFNITGFIFRGNYFENHPTNRHELVFALHHLSSEESPVDLNSTKKIDTIIKKAPFPETMKKKETLFIRSLYRGKASIENPINLSSENMMQFGLSSDNDLSNFFEYLRSNGNVILRDTSSLNRKACYLSAQGIDLAESSIASDHQYPDATQSILTMLEAMKPFGTDDDYLDIAKSLETEVTNDKPHMAIDRVHTLLVKFFRNICGRHGIQTTDDERLDGVFNRYSRWLLDEKHFKSDQTKKIMSLTTKVLVEINDLRNKSSAAHDNDLLSAMESSLVLILISHVVIFICFIERNIIDK